MHKSIAKSCWSYFKVLDNSLALLSLYIMFSLRACYCIPHFNLFSTWENFHIHSHIIKSEIWWLVELGFKPAFVAPWWIGCEGSGYSNCFRYSLLLLLLLKFPSLAKQLVLDTNIHYCNFLYSLHDRKICVLGMCTLLQLGPERLNVLQECHTQILPSMLMLFQGLKRAYAGLFGYMSVILAVS